MPRGAGGVPTSFWKYLGPIADQAFASPFFNPKEQGLADAIAVCKFVAGTKWGPDLYKKAYDIELACPDDATAIKLPFARFAVALAAYQMSHENNPFDSRRDLALDADGDGLFPLDDFTDEENFGHDLFYGVNTSGSTIEINNGSALVPVPVNAACVKCHAARPKGVVGTPPFGVADDGSEPFQTYADSRFHTLGLPRNPEIMTQSGADFGLARQGGLQCGEFSTTSLRNLTKKPNPQFVKAYMHNGYFKDLWQVVHYYNTRNTARVDCTGALYSNVNGPTGFGCLDIAGVLQPTNHDVKTCVTREEGWTAEEAIADDCWPEPEIKTCSDGTTDPPFGFGIPNAFGNLGLTTEEEEAIVAYLETLDDTSTVQPPKPYQAPGQKKK